MSSFQSSPKLQPSLLDRLIDLDPEVKKDVRIGQTLSELKESVRRDLLNLLNTRVAFTNIPSDMPLLRSSLINYGIPDLAGTSIQSSQSLNELCKNIKEAIGHFEKRLRDVRVELDRSANTQLSRTVHFRIEGELIADPYIEPVEYSSSLNAIAKEFDVREASR